MAALTDPTKISMASGTPLAPLQSVVTIMRNWYAGLGAGIGAFTTLDLSTSAPVTPVFARQYKNGLRAFVNFTDNGAVTVGDVFNATVTRNGAGDYTIGFPTAMATATYAAVISGRLGAGTTFLGMEQHDAPIRTTTALKIYTLDLTGTPTNAVVCSVAIFGA